MEDFKRKRLNEENELDDYDKHLIRRQRWYPGNSKKNLEEAALSFTKVSDAG